MLTTNSARWVGVSSRLSFVGFPTVGVKYPGFVPLTCV